MAIYGIDLGTTNSLIGLHSTGYLSDLIPSCVDMESGKAGKDLFEVMTAKRSFKVDMSMGTEGISSRVASKFVLKELIRQVKNDTVKEVVISVPAYFSDNQRQATLESAKQAGLIVRALVNEPTAAAMYIANQQQGLYVIYDLGGGTFDCSIIDSRFGMFDVQATDGCKIGGDNFDANLMRYFIKSGRIPIQKLTKEMRLALQHYASKVKIRMQKERCAIPVNLTDWGGANMSLTPDEYVSIMKMTFAETVNCMQKLLRSWIPSTERYQILLVGGSTHCPYLTEWITEVTGQKPDPLTYDPDRVVAQGAALYASLVESGEVHTQVSDVTKQLGIRLFDGTVDVLIPGNSKIPLSVEKMFTNSETSDTLVLDLMQGNSLFAKDNECIGTLKFKYTEVKEAQEGQVLVDINVDQSGIITLAASELLGEKQSIQLVRKG